MKSTKTEKKGLLSGFLKSSFWDSKVKTANTSKRELWLGYILGVWGMMMTSSVVNSYYNNYLTNEMGFTSEASGFLWVGVFMTLFPVISKLLDGVTNILMSKVLDMTVCKQGKARPWLIISAPIVLITAIMMFWIPFSSTALPANTYYILSAIWITVSFNLYYSFAFTIWNMSKELLPALSTRNVSQRKNLSMGTTIVSNVGTGIVSILIPQLLKVIGLITANNNVKSYLILVSIIGLLAVACTLVQYFWTRERITEERRNQANVVLSEAEQQKAKQDAVIAKERPLLEQFKVVIKEKYWVIFVVLILVTSILANMRNISLVYYCQFVVYGNRYWDYANVQSKFQMIALSPMGPGIAIMIPLSRKIGRTKTIWTSAILTVVGSIFAFMMAGRESAVMIYIGTAVAAIGNIGFSYLNMTFLGDVIDYIEWKHKIRAEGITVGVVSAVTMFAVGIAQGIFNAGLNISGYKFVIDTALSTDTVTYAKDITQAATTWINFSYQGSYIIIGAICFIIYAFFFKIEKHLPTVEKELQERRKAECEAAGFTYISPSQLQEQERIEQAEQAEANRIADLKAKCEAKHLDFEAENAKYLAEQEEKKAKAAAKKADKEAKKKTKK